MNPYDLEMLGAGIAGGSYLAVSGSAGPTWLTVLEILLAVSLIVSGGGSLMLRKLQPR